MTHAWHQGLRTLRAKVDADHRLELQLRKFTRTSVGNMYVLVPTQVEGPQQGQRLPRKPKWLRRSTIPRHFRYPQIQVEGYLHVLPDCIPILHLLSQCIPSHASTKLRFMVRALVREQQSVRCEGFIAHTCHYATSALLWIPQLTHHVLAQIPQPLVNRQTNEDRDARPWTA